MKPAEARAQFEVWQKSHPEDLLARALEAAAYLIEECYQQGVLTSEFFLDNQRFLGKVALKPNPQLRAAFFVADKQAQDLAQLRLKTNPDDTNALFAMTLSVGMQADYASLIDKHQLESLKILRDADGYAKKLLAVAPEAGDAYFTLGAVNYIIGSLPRYKRFFLVFAGIRGDKKAGIQQLEMAAKHGHYLRPFAKIMLALAALRESNKEVARIQLEELVAEFPQNQLFLVNWPSSMFLPPRKFPGRSEQRSVSVGRNHSSQSLSQWIESRLVVVTGFRPSKLMGWALAASGPRRIRSELEDFSPNLCEQLFRELSVERRMS